MTDSAGLEVNLVDDGNIPLDARISCQPGELLALVGPSGSGKSTILRTIAGLNKPRKGLIHCNGDTWLDTDKGVDVSTRQRRVGMVFQNYALFPHLSARDNIIEGLGHVAPAERSRRAEELLTLVHLSGLGMRKPAALSGGQQQRVAVARALARDPKVLLLDEPFSAVDQATRQRLYRELVELRQQFGMPMVLVTHDLDEAAMLADRLCILRHGRTLQSGQPFDVLAKPTNKQVARLVDQKNIFQGTIINHDEALGVTTISWGEFTLQAPHQPDFKIGKVIDWLIPASHVAVGDDENVVAGVIAGMVRLGDLVTISVTIKEASSHPLFMSLSVREAKQRDLKAGEIISVSLIGDGIHLMEP
ncbi:MAG: ABC transporter ATP-binding protein [Rhodospirillaceae bacterium]|nr:ABC transporter ATP-binding protein [Rhodospirillaceae bacterium]MBL6930455.1 ABC transporter ATP-binding protein [Rhodospirillales bacterium]MBL6942187.1 ABC transporter ATP-binding protein [Rhodospirillales bacterium]